MKRKLLAALLCGAMMTTLAPVQNMWAEEPARTEDVEQGQNVVAASGNYLVWDDAQKQLVPEKIPEGAKDITEVIKGDNATLKGGENDAMAYYFVTASEQPVTIDKRIIIEGKVTLILMDGCTLNAEKGIQVAEGNALAIAAQSTGDTQGKLIATSSSEDSDNYNAAIGGSNVPVGGSSEKSAGTITINGGDISAIIKTTGSDTNHGAGIGGALQGSGGTININGGKVAVTLDAAGWNFAAGIGGGYGGSGGYITINDGTVDVTVTTEDNNYGSGIGGGCEGDGGKITINNGTVDVSVNSVFNNSAAGIGGGYNAAAGDINIDGGTIAISMNISKTNDGAGIGGGAGGVGGKIIIDGGKTTVTLDKAQMNEGAGIGGGDDGNVEEITINDGTVTVTMKAIAYNDEGIGGGDSAEAGTFSTGENGKAVIITPSIQDQSGKEQWKGVIFQQNEEKELVGAVYGTEVAPTTDWTIPEGATLTVAPRQTLRIPEGVTLTNQGTIDNQGTIKNFGTIEQRGLINGPVAEKEATPEIAVRNDTLTGFDSAGSYIINGNAVVLDANGNLAIEEAWYGTTLSIVKKSEVDEQLNSAAQQLTIPAKPEPPYTGKYSYEIFTDKLEHGAINVDRYATEGEKVTLAVTPDDGYAVDAVTVTTKGGKEVEVTDNGDGSYSFVMPSGDAKLHVAFTEVETPEPTPSVSDIFSDVATDAWYVDAVQFAYDEGIMTGTSETTFSPEFTTTRGMIVAILHRLEGSPDASGDRFVDVANGDWYAEAVNWAASESIVNGTSATTFAPNAWVTREQLAAILHNYAEYKGMDVSARADLSVYDDAASISDWANDVMQWAVGEKLISGVTNDTLAPQGNATRAQVAAIFQRFLSK